MNYTHSELSAVENRFDGPIPQQLLDAARYGDIRIPVIYRHQAGAKYFRRCIAETIRNLREHGDDPSWRDRLLTNLHDSIRSFRFSNNAAWKLIREVQWDATKADIRCRAAAADGHVDVIEDAA